ncbi:MAG: hypothetical protein ACREUR_04240 [Nitrosospira sp.]
MKKVNILWPTPHWANKQSNLKARPGVRQFADVDKLITATNIMQTFEGAHREYVDLKGTARRQHSQ